MRGIEEVPLSRPADRTGRTAFATLVTNEEYGRGALALKRSLRATGTAHPLLVLATGEAEHLDELEREGCRIVPVGQPPRRVEQFAIGLGDRLQMDIAAKIVFFAQYARGLDQLLHRVVGAFHDSR